jgi:hypothetical protein
MYYDLARSPTLCQNKNSIYQGSGEDPLFER